LGGEVLVAMQTSSPREAAASSTRRLPYHAALDGMRALAVAAVLAYHAGMPWARGGFLGVDAFFVLSGYLITNLLLHEWRTEGGIGLVAFWSRRARRLLPALFLMLAGVAVYAVVIARPEELDKLRGDALATIGYVANWRPVFSGQSYFDQFSVPSPLRHTWSLAIEEQYYAIWPLVLVFLLGVRRVSMRTVLGVTLLMLAASALLMALLFQPGHDPSRVYYGTDTRAQSLLVGAALSMLLTRLPAGRHGLGPVRGFLPRATLEIVAIACVVVLAAAWMTTSSSSVALYRGGFLFLALCVSAVITAAVQPGGGLVRRALSLPPLRGLGLISYGVYLWHWPIYLELTPARTGYDGYHLFLLRVLATLAVATVSYMLVESPIRRGAFSGLKVSWGFAPGAAAGVAVALLLVTRGGTTSLSLSTVPMAPMPSTAAAPPAADASAAVVDAPLRVLLVGDSVGLSLGWGFAMEDASLGLATWNRAGMGCGFMSIDEERDDDGSWTSLRPERCKEWRAGWSSDVEAFQPDLVVMLFGPWDTLDLKVGDQLLEVGTPEWRAYAWDQLQSAVDTFSADKAKVVLLTAPCFKPRDMALAPTIGGQHLNVWPVEPLNDLYRDFALLHPKVSVIDLDGYMCPGGDYTDLKIDGVQIRSDGVHFSPEGAAIVADWLGPRIKEVMTAAAPPVN
jgi:peptidoglycan/LPS O-acetylase OafA/YrhL